MRMKMRMKKKPAYEIEMIILQKGANIHVKRKLDNLNDVVKIDGFSYKIEPEALFIKKPNVIKRLYNKLRGVKAEFITIYRYGSSEPIKEYTSKLSPYLLKTIKGSSALKRALEKELKGAFDIRKLIFITIVAIASIFIYYYMIGGI